MAYAEKEVGEGFGKGQRVEQGEELAWDKDQEKQEAAQDYFYHYNLRE